MGLRIDVPASIVGCAVDATARRMGATGPATNAAAGERRRASTNGDMGASCDGI